MHCKVTFTPKYANGNLTYGVVYAIDKDNPDASDNKYDVEYDRVVYKLGGKVKFKSLPSSGSVRIPLTRGFEYRASDVPWKDGSGEPNIVKELVSSHISDIFGTTEVAALFVEINNRLGVDELDVETSLLDNPGMTDGIWPIGEPYQVPSGGELVSTSRGWTYIRGKAYRVSEDDLRLEPVSGSDGYGVSDI